jgi:hypothetical protein
VAQKSVLQMAMGVHEIDISGIIPSGHTVFLFRLCAPCPLCYPVLVDELPGKQGGKGMENLLYVLVIVGIWVVLVKVVFPKIGIHG